MPEGWFDCYSDPEPQEEKGAVLDRSRYQALRAGNSFDSLQYYKKFYTLRENFTAAATAYNDDNAISDMMIAVARARKDSVAAWFATHAAQSVADYCALRDVANTGTEDKVREVLIRCGVRAGLILDFPARAHDADGKTMRHVMAVISHYKGYDTTGDEWEGFANGIPGYAASGNNPDDYIIPHLRAGTAPPYPAEILEIVKKNQAKWKELTLVTDACANLQDRIDALYNQACARRADAQQQEKALHEATDIVSRTMVSALGHVAAHRYAALQAISAGERQTAHTHIRIMAGMVMKTFPHLGAAQPDICDFITPCLTAFGGSAENAAALCNVLIESGYPYPLQRLAEHCLQPGNNAFVQPLHKGLMKLAQSDEDGFARVEGFLMRHDAAGLNLLARAAGHNNMFHALLSIFPEPENQWRILNRAIQETRDPRAAQLLRSRMAQRDQLLREKTWGGGTGYRNYQYVNIKNKGFYSSNAGVSWTTRWFKPK